MTNAIEASGLVKRFGKTTALAGVDLVARQGTVLGVLGPNGAGKTDRRPDPGHPAPCRTAGRPGCAGTTSGARPTRCAS